jgi:photosystem II stability/assembly factor-like uncharacterized protein
VTDSIYLDSETYIYTIEFDPIYPETLYLGTGGFLGGSLYRSTNGGLSWKRFWHPIEIRGSWQALVVHPETTNILYSSIDVVARVHKSSDRGETWSVLGVEDITDLDVDHCNPVIVYASSRGPSLGTYFLRSTDAGTSWSVSSSGLDIGLAYLIVNPVTGYLYASGNHSIYISKDYGISWQYMNGMAGFITNIVFDQSNEYLCIGVSQIGVYIRKIGW